MITIRPFQGLRPARNIAAKVACHPYDVISSADARAEAEGNEQSFYHIDKPEIDLPEGIDTHSPEVYAKGRENLELFIKNGWLKRDSTGCLYIYAQEMDGRRQTGLVAGSSVDDYNSGKIKRHEYTRPDKEKDRIDHMRALKAHPGKVFLAYKPVAEIDAVIETVTQKKAEYDFEDNQGVRHLFWVINDAPTVEKLVKLFAEKVPASYIADGHHRAAASAKVGEEFRKNNPDHTGDEPYNYFLSVLFPANQLKILPYNRVIKDFNGLTTTAFLQGIGNHFALDLKGKAPYAPKKIHEIGMYMRGNWYSLTARPNTYDKGDPVSLMDVSVLTDYILKPVLDIQDQRTSDRIDFVGGIKGLDELKKRVDSGEMAAAFSMYPVSMQQLMAVADSGNVMPPKSTWFEPKLKSGLVVNLFD